MAVAPIGVGKKRGSGLFAWVLFLFRTPVGFNWGVIGEVAGNRSRVTGRR
jgi:hypothetical protein